MYFYTSVLFHFGQFFPFLQPKTISPKQPKNIKFQKKLEKHLEMSSFYTCVQKIMIRWCTVPEIWLATDGQTENATYRGGCPTLKLHNIKISSHDLLQKLHKTDFAWNTSQDFLRKGVQKQEFFAFRINFFENKQKRFS